MVVICLGPICLPLWPLIALTVKPVWDRVFPVTTKQWLHSNWTKLQDCICRRRSNSSVRHKPAATGGSEVRNIQSEVDYSTLLSVSNELPVIIKFTAEFCGPCKLIDPVFRELSIGHRGKMVFAEIDIEQQDDLAIRLGVSSIPAFHVVKDSCKVEQLVGANAEKLESLVKKHSRSVITGQDDKKIR